MNTETRASSFRKECYRVENYVKTHFERKVGKERIQKRATGGRIRQEVRMKTK
jgi:hypothetical protein